MLQSLLGMISLHTNWTARVSKKHQRSNLHTTPEAVVIYVHDKLIVIELMQHGQKRIPAIGVRNIPLQYVPKRQAKKKKKKKDKKDGIRV